MKITPASIPNVLVIEPDVFHDTRGFFFESFNERKWRELTGIAEPFVQDNHTQSKKNVLRGLHYQIKQPQGKLVRVVRGEIFDVAVDLRRSSPTFGRWLGTTLSASNKRLLWLPKGFAHGFLSLSDETDVLYKTTDYWAPEYERTIAWDDPDLAISWPLTHAPTLADKDRNAPQFTSAETFA